jgi:hypothetical protein
MKSRYIIKRLSSLHEETKPKTTRSKQNKPDFLDVDGDGNKKESMKKAIKDKKNKGKKKSIKESLTFAEVVKGILEK